MDRLYTPWRFAYVTGSKSDDGCVFCGVLASDDDEGNHVLHRAGSWTVMLNRYPYNNGHLLLVLNRHAPQLQDLEPSELEEMGRLLALMERALAESLAPHGFNCGYNGGRSAGAGIPEHLHLHLLPRWSGDTNFMTTVGETRVLPQTLAEVHARVGGAILRLLGESS
jgi:ATP adenylyltransferase